MVRPIKLIMKVNSLKYHMPLNYRNQIVTDDFENSYYYDYQGTIVKNQYVTIYHLENDYLNPKIKKVTYYAGYDGKFLHGPQTINGVAVYFNVYGEQIKDQFADDGYYYDKDTGARVKFRSQPISYDKW